jgi:hypothetical protein
MAKLLPRVVAAIGCAYLVTLLAGASIEGQAVTAQSDQRKAFINASQSRLSDKGSSYQLAEVQSKAKLWQKTKSENDWVVLTEAVYDVARKLDTKSSVTINSSAGPGATVKYQTLGERKRNETPTTAKTPTEAHEAMYIGTYHIWSERRGKPTSDKNAQYQIANEKEKVVLAENE